MLAELDKQYIWFLSWKKISQITKTTYLFLLFIKLLLLFMQFLELYVIYPLPQKINIPHFQNIKAGYERYMYTRVWGKFSPIEETQHRKQR
jgi:hypothetical protein